MSQTIHLAPGETLTVIADYAGPRCTATVIGPIVHSPFGDHTTAEVKGSGLAAERTYSVWGYGTNATGRKGYAQGTQGTADADGNVTLTVEVALDVDDWYLSLYSVPGTPSTTTVAECELELA